MFGSVRTAEKFASSLTWVNNAHRSTCSLTKMLSSTRYSIRISEAGRPRGLRGFARVGLVMAWTVFWLSTAIFPCCESIAALVAGDHLDEVTQSDSADPQVHQSGDVHAEGPERDPYAPCEHALGAGPVLVGEPAVLTPDRFPLHWLAVEEQIAPGLTTAAHRPSLALPQADPPPPPRFYLRTQRLLI